MNLPSVPSVPILRVSRCLGHHAHRVGALLGACMALLCITAAAWITGEQVVHTTDGHHHQVFDRMRAMQTDIAATLTELNTTYQASCTNDNLVRLRSLLIAHPFALDIGLLDAQRNLFCTTSAGLLPHPILPEGHIIDGSVGRYYMTVPTQHFNPWVMPSLRSMVVERGPFQVMADNSESRIVMQQYADAVWAGGTKQRRLVFKSQGPHGDIIDTVVTADTPHMRIDLRAQMLVITNMVPGISPIFVQSVVPLWEVYLQSPILWSGLLALCLVLGGLTNNWATRRCKELLSMDFRIRYLCRPEHVVCHYQPMVALPSGSIVGCEVLARLQDGDNLIYPDAFIPALRRNKLTWQFDAMVSRKALHALAAALPAQERPFSVALNFFPHNLKRDIVHPHLQAILGVLGRTDLHIHLEVTEYDFSKHLIPDLRYLKTEGYSISIDDFGTGYSNLGVVKHIAPDYLKIDKSFVFEMGDTTIRSSLIPEIIAIANAIGSTVVAEGIETQTQVMRLCALGVQYGQGYYFARPLALDALLTLLQENQQRRAQA